MYYDFTIRENILYQKEREKVEKQYPLFDSCGSLELKFLYLRLKKLNKLDFLDDIENHIKTSFDVHSSIPLVDKWLDQELGNDENRNNEYFIAHILWDCLTDVPIDENERIEMDWLDFPRGTHREEIWHWFEETFHVSVHDLFEEHDELVRQEAILYKEPMERER